MTALENILYKPWQAAFEGYAGPFGNFEELFFGIFLIVVPTIIVGMKTQRIEPPLMVMIIGSFLVSPFTGKYGGYFLLMAGVLFGILFYKMAKGYQNRF